DTATVTDQAVNDSATLALIGRYDSNATVGVTTAAQVNAEIVHNVTSQLGASQLDFKIGNPAALVASLSSGGLDLATGETYKIGGDQISSANLSDSANIAHINVAETLSANWVNTTYPWADNEVSDTLTASMFVGTGSLTTAVDLATAEVSGVLPNANVADDLTISGGTINNSIIGATTAAAGTFTTLTVTTDAVLPTGSIQTGEIQDGTILNADIASAAAIAWSKLDQTSVPDVIIGVQQKTVSYATGSTFTFTSSLGQSSGSPKSDGIVVVGNEGTNYNYANVELFDNTTGNPAKATSGANIGNQLWGRITSFASGTPNTITVTIYDSTDRTAASPTAHTKGGSDPATLQVIFPARYRLGTMS
ncbi:MAG: hypothetical protein COW10_05905, partial [Candidatus Omnitrophica bacterium CG12_big_fil_rev_8_21_14_0_65_42_8]